MALCVGEALVGSISESFDCLRESFFRCGLLLARGLHFRIVMLGHLTNLRVAVLS